MFFCRIIFKALHRLTEHDIPVQCPLKERERERERESGTSLTVGGILLSEQNFK